MASRIVFVTYYNQLKNKKKEERGNRSAAVPF